MLNKLPGRGVGGQVGWMFTCSYLGHEFNSHSGQSSDPNRSFLEIGALFFFILSVTIEYVNAD